MTNPHPLGSFWYQAAEIFGAPDIKYCEETISHFISEPANTWSNLVIILAGLLVHMKHKKINHLMDYYGLSVMMMGFLSFVYHLSNNFLTQYLDFLGMYAAIGLLLFINLDKLNLVSKSKLNRLYLLSFIPFTVIILVMRTFKVAVQKSIIIVIAIVIGLEAYRYFKSRVFHQSYRTLLLGLLSVLIAVTFQLIDIHRIYCDSSNHFIQPHALWHTFNGLAFYLFYFYFSDVVSLEEEKSDVA